MIINAILLVVQGVLDILLLPLTGLNIAIDFLSSIPVVFGFFQVIAYVVPWSNIMPLITLLIGIFIFRSVVSLIKTINNIIPFF